MLGICLCDAGHVSVRCISTCKASVLGMCLCDARIHQHMRGVWPFVSSILLLPSHHAPPTQCIASIRPVDHPLPALSGGVSLAVAANHPRVCVCNERSRTPLPTCPCPPPCPPLPACPCPSPSAYTIDSCTHAYVHTHMYTRICIHTYHAPITHIIRPACMQILRLALRGHPNPLPRHHGRGPLRAPAHRHGAVGGSVGRSVDRRERGGVYVWFLCTGG